MAEHDDTTAAPSKTTPKNDTHSKMRGPLPVPMAAAALPATRRPPTLSAPVALDRALSDLGEKIKHLWDRPLRDPDYLWQAVGKIDHWRADWRAADQPATIEQLQIQLAVLTAGYSHIGRPQLAEFAEVFATDVGDLQPTTFELVMAAKAVRLNHKFLTIAAFVEEFKAAQAKAVGHRQTLAYIDSIKFDSDGLQQRLADARAAQERRRLADAARERQLQRKQAGLFGWWLNDAEFAALQAEMKENPDYETWQTINKRLERSIRALPNMERNDALVMLWKKEEQEYEAFKERKRRAARQPVERVAQRTKGQLQEEWRADQARWAANQRQAEQEFKEKMARLGDAPHGLAKLLKEQRQERDDDWVQREDRQERDAFMAKLMKEGDSATTLADFDIGEMLERPDQQQDPDAAEEERS
jgi:hypothetical protein